MFDLLPTSEDMFLILAIITLLAFPVVAWRSFPFRSPFFSGIFILALCPFLFTALFAIVRVQHLLAFENQDAEYIVGRLRATLEACTTSLVLSTILSVAYSVLYFVRRSRPGV
jgi:hypothetical protein